MSIFSRSFNFLNPNTLSQTMKNTPQFFPGSELIIIPILAILFVVALVITSICSCFSGLFNSGRNRNPGYGQTVYADTSYVQGGYRNRSIFGSLFDTGPSQGYVSSPHRHSSPSTPYTAPSTRGGYVNTSGPSMPYTQGSSSMYRPAPSQTVRSHQSHSAHGGPSTPSMSQGGLGQGVR